MASTTTKLDKWEDLIYHLKHKTFDSDYDLTEAITNTFKLAIQVYDWHSGRDLFQSLQKIGQKLIQADKMNFVVMNIVKRILHIVRERAQQFKISLKDPSSSTDVRMFFRIDSLQ